MKIAEEIKALDAMGVDVSRYLLLPMLGAFLVMLPVMEIYTVGIGFLGAFGTWSFIMGMDADQFVLQGVEGRVERRAHWRWQIRAVCSSGGDDRLS